jgi:hypothetical protein
VSIAINQQSVESAEMTMGLLLMCLSQSLNQSINIYNSNSISISISVSSQHLYLPLPFLLGLYAQIHHYRERKFNTQVRAPNPNLAWQCAHTNSETVVINADKELGLGSFWPACLPWLRR